MYLGVYAYQGEGTCVSVGAHLMKGENDNHLPWPFTGKLTVELLNQLEDDNHYSKTMIFPPDIEVSGQGTTKQKLGYATIYNVFPT